MGSTAEPAQPTARFSGDSLLRRGVRLQHSRKRSCQMALGTAESPDHRRSVKFFVVFDFRLSHADVCAFFCLFNQFYTCFERVLHRTPHNNTAETISRLWNVVPCVLIGFQCAFREAAEEDNCHRSRSTFLEARNAQQETRTERESDGK